MFAFATTKAAGLTLTMLTLALRVSSQTVISSTPTPTSTSPVSSSSLAPTPSPACARNYTVQSGDFCDKISATQHVSTYQLANVNQGIINADCSNLFVGQVLCLGLVGQDCTNTVVIKSGDSCDAIAQAAGISFATLRTNNPNVDADCTNIYPDEVLCVQGA